MMSQCLCRFAMQLVQFKFALKFTEGFTVA
jgi:hypothetical protein